MAISAKCGAYKGNPFNKKPTTLMLQIHQLGAGIGAAALAASLAAFARWTLKVDNVEDAVRQLQLGIDKYHEFLLKTCCSTWTSI